MIVVFTFKYLCLSFFLRTLFLNGDDADDYNHFFSIITLTTDNDCCYHTPLLLLYWLGRQR